MILHPELLHGVHPALQRFAEEAALVLGPTVDLGVVFGMRTDAQQEALYAKGRTISSGINVSAEHPLGIPVTNAKKAAETPHGRGAAIDVCPVLAGHWQWDDVPAFQRLGNLAEAHGLVWGGRWTSPRDLGHVQLRAWHLLPFTPPEETHHG